MLRLGLSLAMVKGLLPKVMKEMRVERRGKAERGRAAKGLLPR